MERDFPDIMGLVRAVSWPHRPHDVRVSMDLGHPWVVRLHPNGRVVGTAVWWAFGETAGRLGLVIVSPEEQGRGLGRLLVEHCLDEAGARALMLLSTDEGRSLYERYDFRVVGDTQRHQGVFSGAAISSPRTRVAESDDYRGAVMQLDAAVTGADRGTVLQHLFEVGETTLLIEDGCIAGYAVTRAFGRGSVVGPIVAPSERDAVELFDASVPNGVVRVDRPLCTERFGTHLATRGITPHEVTKVMVLGNWPADAASGCAFAMASHAWG